MATIGYLLIIGLIVFGIWFAFKIESKRSVTEDNEEDY